MINRQSHLMILFLGILAVSFSSPGIAGPVYIDIYAGINFHSTATSGAINFTDEFATSNILMAGSLVTFSDFDMGGPWTTLGFGAPVGGTMEINAVSEDVITCELDPGVGSKTWNIYVAGKGSPVSVSGASSWSYSSPSQIVILNMDALGTVTVSWAVAAVPSISGDPPNPTDFISAIETNFLTGIIVTYTGLIGPAFWGIVALIALIPLQNRVGLMPLIGIALLLWIDLEYVIPAAGLQIGMAVLILGGAAVLTMLFFARRRQYG
jgi:hypothetical protein